MNLKEVNTFQHLAVIENIISKGGPLPDEYEVFESCLAILTSDEVNPKEHLLKEVLDSCGFLQDKRSLMGHIRSKPFGYAGDFQVIDRIYQQNVVEDSYQRWDRYSLQHPAARAVRNRKRYFKQQMVRILSSGDDLSLLNVASGPARDIHELYQELTDPVQLQTTCVEMDHHAIDYASELNSAYLDHIHFVQSNIFRFASHKKYDVLWSAGLFDYFNDDAFVWLLRRMGSWIKPGGEMIIGNFNDDCNPSRLFMELFGDWKLNHRNAAHLIRLAEQAGYCPSSISIGREEEQINLFLHIQF